MLVAAHVKACEDRIMKVNKMNIKPARIGR